MQQLSAQAVTATSDGLTTGRIRHDTTFASVTSASANNIATLPVGYVGQVIKGWVGATGFELRTIAASGDTINTVDSDGTQEAAIPATSLFTVTCVADSTWVLEVTSELGATVTAIVPD